MLYLIFSEEGGKKRMTPFMEWNLNCLRAIAELRTPLLDTLMQGVTELGGETLFMLFMLVVFWCVDKNKGYFLMLLCFTGTAVNQMLKITFCIPRPWVLDPSFEIVESARAGATGFSFPSGHTQNAVAAYGGMFCITKKLWVRVVCMALALLIPFSRLYLGVHTPLDVGVSFLIGWLLVLAFYPLLEEIGHRGEVLEHIWLILLVPAALFLLYALRVRAGTSDILLAHLSDENNSPQLAEYTVGRALQSSGLSVRLAAAPRDTISEVHVCRRSPSFASEN